MDFSSIYFKEHDRHISETALLDGKEYHSFISADYYSLNTHPKVKQAAIQAIETFGTSMSVGQFSDRSPMINKLEMRLSAVAEMDASCIFTSCYMANYGAINSLAKLDKVFFLYDQYCHSSIVSALRGSKAEFASFKHNDMSDLAAKLDWNYGKQVVVITEGLFSADGDFVDLEGLQSLKKSFGFLLYIDEAHSFLLSESQMNIADRFSSVDAETIDLITGSLSKALCSTGGFVVGSSNMIERIKMSREYIFSTGITPSNIAASLACLEILSMTDRHTALSENIHYFRQQAAVNELNLGASDTASPVFTIYPQSSCIELYQSLLEKGVLVQPLLYPAVPKDQERLRVLINTAHSFEQLDALIDSV